MNSPSKQSRKSKQSQLVGMYWATRVSSIGMQMAIMPGLGFLADRYFGTLPWLTLVGACLGFGLAMREVFRLAQGGVDRSPGDPPSDNPGRSSDR
jgi:F0F1-type ATP synthase assembly protein I